MLILLYSTRRLLLPAPHCLVGYLGTAHSPSSLSLTLCLSIKTFMSSANTARTSLTPKTQLRLLLRQNALTACEERSARTPR